MTALTKTTLTKLDPGTTGADAASFQYVASSAQRFDDVVASLAAEIDRAGLKLLQQIDVQGALAGAGHAVGGFRLLFFFHPSLVARVITADVAAMIEAPLKLVVFENPDATVSLRIADPAIAFARYGNADLAQLGRELAGTVDRIVQAAI